MRQVSGQCTLWLWDAAVLINTRYCLKLGCLYVHVAVG